MAFEQIIGNENLKKFFASNIRTKSLSHAYILEGSYGSGKHTIARNIAAALECTNANDDVWPCGKCPSCKKILSDLSCDVITIKKEDGKAQMGVDVIRNLTKDIHIAPNDGNTKVYILEDADSMNVQAQNAFLLSMEEPPSYVLFFLLCENSMNLLETIRSRAQTIHVSPLNDAQVEEYLRKNNPDVNRMTYADFSGIVNMAKGSIGRAIQLLDGNERKDILAYRELTDRFIRFISSSNNASNGVEFLQELPTKRDQLLTLFGMFQTALRDMIACKNCENPPLCFFTDKETPMEIGNQFSTNRMISLYEKIEGYMDSLRMNASVKLVLTSLGIECNLY